MTDRINLDYYRRREAQERAVAARTIDKMAQRLHLDMAERYAGLAQGMPQAEAPLA